MSGASKEAPATPAQGEATPVDFLTVLTCEPDHLLTKTWIADVAKDGAVIPSTKAMYFGIEERGIDGIGGLLAALREAATNPRAGIIRGRHLGQEHEARVEPCAHKPKRGSLRRNSCVEDVPHHWVMIDADSWPAGDLLKTEDPRLACIAYIKKELPEEFHGRSFIWQLSSKAGHASIPADELRVHLWFWLSEPRTSDELKAWAERHMAKRTTPPEGADQGKAKPPIDTALFQKIQLHYVANPVMGDGVTDPIETRIGYVRGGLGDEVVLNLDAATASDAKAATAAENERTRGGEWVGPGRKHTLHDPVVAALEERGLVRDSTPGKVILECPWQGDHSTAMHDGDTSTALMRHPFGFSCLHASHRKGAKDEKKLPHLLDFLGIDENKVKSMPSFEVLEKPTPEDLAEQERVKRRNARPVFASPATDAGLAWRFALQNEGRLLFDHSKKQWRIYARGVWGTTTKGEETERFKAMVAGIAKEAAGLTDTAAAKLFAAAGRASATRVVTAAKQLAQSDPLLSAAGADFDTDGDMLCAANGVIDLATGNLLPHDPALMMTKQSPVIYDPAAECPLFLQFMAEISCGDPTWVSSMQAILGYSIGGSVAAEMLFFWFGVGANGKSVLANLIGFIFGGYSVTLPAAFLNQRKEQQAGAATPELAALAGARMGSANELEPGMKLSTQTLKVSTSTEPITARNPFGQLFTFKPTAKVHIRGNYRPEVTGTDEGTWRRLILIPFDLQLPPEKRDPGLEERLRTEAPGILRWLIEGHLRLRREGVRSLLCRRIRQASQAYRDESDPVAQWLDARAELVPGTDTEQSDAFQRFNSWAHEEGVRAVSKRTFTSALLQRGVLEGRASTGTPRAQLYRGLRILG